MEGILTVSGLLSAVFFLINLLFYYVARFAARIRKKDGALNLRMEKFHCLTGILSLVFAAVHVCDKLIIINFTPGYLSLLFLILIVLSGFLEKRFKGSHSGVLWKYNHILLTYGFLVSFVFHIIDKIRN